MTLKPFSKFFFRGRIQIFLQGGGGTQDIILLQTFLHIFSFQFNTASGATNHYVLFRNKFCILSASLACWHVARNFAMGSDRDGLGRSPGILQFFCKNILIKTKIEKGTPFKGFITKTIKQASNFKEDMPKTAVSRKFKAHQLGLARPK